MTIRIDVQGIPQMRDKLGRFAHNYIPDEMQYLTMEAAEIALADMEQNGPRDLGAGIANMYAEPIGLGAQVVVPDQYMGVQNYGRTPGSRMPPADALRGWAARHGIPQSAVWAIARSIGRRGIRGKYFVEHAAQKAQASLATLLAKTSVRITQRWDSEP